MRKELGVSGFSFELVPLAPKFSRYYVRYGDVYKFDRGFRSRKDVDEWIESFGASIVDQDPLQLRFRLDGDLNSIFIINRAGRVCKR